MDRPEVYFARRSFVLTLIGCDCCFGEFPDRSNFQCGHGIYVTSDFGFCCFETRFTSLWTDGWGYVGCQLCFYASSRYATKCGGFRFGLPANEGYGESRLLAEYYFDYSGDADGVFCTSLDVGN